MCGITGGIQLSDKNIPFESHIEKALSVLDKRGPDNSEHKLVQGGVLGHTRLSIIDVSSSANQPMTDPTGRYTLVFNGEIYNFQTLKNDLPEVSFNTGSDTEVLLHLLIKHKEKALDLLNGFFSFCFYDDQEKSWLISRDRFGIKPLLYYLDQDQLIFASEMKSILAYGIDKQINRAALTSFFQFNYIPEPNTILKNVWKLKPGHFIKITNGKVSVDKYYQYYLNQKTSTDSYDTAKGKVKDLVKSAVEKRMIADVPIGSFLSGGIDSSVIATIASKLTDQLSTFSIGFKDEPLFDETEFAKIVSKKIGSKHTVFSLSNQDIFDHFEQVLDYLDEPFADSSAINVFILCKNTKNNITVALSGDGADELFSGYNKHQALFQASQSNVKNSLIKAGKPLYSLLPKSRNSKLGNLSRQIQKYSEGLKLSSHDRYELWASFMKKEKASKLVIQSSYSDIVKEILPKKIDSFNDYLYTDFNLVLPNDMLRKVDSMSMANSLEVRTPFLDHELVEYVFSLPDHYKIDHSNRKKVLKEAFAEELPQEIFNRGKQGFEIPLLKWFKNDLRSHLNEHVFNETLIREQGFLNWGEVEKIKNQLYSNSPGDSVSSTWALLVFQNWLKKYYF